MGTDGLPTRWMSIQVLVSPRFGGATYGWMGFNSFCCCGFCRRVRQRLFWVRDGSCRLGRMAAHHYADTNRSADRGLRSAHPGLWHSETASGAALAKNLATHPRHGDRHSDRRGPVELYQPGVSAVRRWCVADALHDL